MDIFRNIRADGVIKVLNSAARLALIPSNGTLVEQLDNNTLWSWNANSQTWIQIGAGSGSVSSVSIVTANGFAGIVSNPSTTPAITLSTTITGILKGNGTAISAAVSGTDYQPAGNYITQLNGDGSANGPGNSAFTLSTVNANVGTFNSVTVNGKGLVTAASNVTPALAAIAAYSTLANNTGSTAVPIANQTLILGTPGFTGTGVLSQITGTNTSFLQSIWQNTSNGTGASTDLVLNNNLGTNSTYYANLGINSSTFTGSGSLNLPSASYLTATTGDLVLGTTTSNAIHFLTNGATTDAMSIDASNNTTISLLKLPSLTQQSPSTSYFDLVADSSTGTVRKAPTFTGLQPVLDNTISTPPGSPSVGDAYIVAASPTGAWAGQTNTIATWNGSSWAFYSPATNDKTIVTTGTNAGVSYFYNGSAWVVVPSTAYLPITGGTLTGPLAISGMTTGSVLFIGASGVITQNNPKFFWDNTNIRLGINTTTPNSAVDVAANSLGTTQTTSGGILLSNNTAAAVNAQQISPALRMRGSAWDTTNSVSKTVDMRQSVLTTQGASNLYNGTWLLEASLNGASYVNVMDVLTPVGANNARLRLYDNANAVATAIDPGSGISLGYSGSNHFFISNRSGDPRIAFSFGTGYIDTANYPVQGIVSSISTPSVSTTRPQFAAHYDATNYTTFFTNSSGNMIISPTSSFVGINVTPTAALHIKGTGTDIATIVQKNVDSGGTQTYAADNSGGFFFGKSQTFSVSQAGWTGSNGQGMLNVNPVFTDTNSSNNSQYTMANFSPTINPTSAVNMSSTAIVQINPALKVLSPTSYPSTNPGIAMLDISPKFENFGIYNGIKMLTMSPQLKNWQNNMSGANTMFDIAPSIVYTGSAFNGANSVTMRGFYYHSTFPYEQVTATKEIAWENTVGQVFVGSTWGNLAVGTNAPTALFQVNQPTTGMGTVTNTASGTTVTGLGTQFTNTFKVGDSITIGGQTVVISAIASDTSMTTAAITSAHSTGVAYTLTGGVRLAVLGNGYTGFGTLTPVAPITIYQGTTNVTTQITDRQIGFGRASDGAVTQSISSDTAQQMNYDSRGIHLFRINNVNGLVLVNDSLGNTVVTNIGTATTSLTAKLNVADTVLSGSGSLAGSLVNLTQTWNTSGSPTAIKLNITNTASGTASLLEDLQVGGTSQYKIAKSGKISLASGSNKSTGTATLVAGTIAVSNSEVTANSLIWVQYATGSAPSLGAGSISTLTVSAISAGTSFTITGLTAAGITNVTDTSLVQWWIIN